MAAVAEKDLIYMIDHVFLPPKLPQEDDLDATKEHALCTFIRQAAEAYCECVPATAKLQWIPILKMLKNICISCERFEISEQHVIQSMEDMKPGDVFALLIRAQNAGIIVRRFEDETTFESFEVSPAPEAVMAAKGKLLCSYPGPVVTVPNSIVTDKYFREELASFLVQMNVDILDSAPTTRKAQAEHVEERATAHPRYITELLSGILRGLGEPTEVTRIQKRIADDVLWKEAFKPWRRSSIWLLIRVALQTSLLSEDDKYTEYKSFMIYAMTRMVRVGAYYKLPSDLLFCMRAKMSRRLYKLRHDVPSFVTRIVKATGDAVEKLVQERWEKVQEDQGASPQWAPSELDFNQDTILSLSNSKNYLSAVLQDKPGSDSSNTFHPTHYPRLHGFDNQGLTAAFRSNKYIALADFEFAVQEHLDDWVEENLHNASGCPTLSSCITQYYDAAHVSYSSNPEDMSLMLLTIFDLWVGLDTLAVAQCPLLARYSPEIPLGLLEPLLLRRSKSFQRLKQIQEYLHGRHSGATPGLSVFTDTKSSSSFEVRYFEGSGEHKSLLSRIEEEASQQREQKLQELSRMNHTYERLNDQARSMNCTYGFSEWSGRYHSSSCQKCALESQANSMKIEVHEWPLPKGSSEAKSVVFELQLPIVFNSWRTTVFKILIDICTEHSEHRVNPPVLLENYPGLQEYVCSPVSRITIASTTKSFLHSHYRTTRIPEYNPDAVCVNNGLQYRLFDKTRMFWAADSFTDCTIARYCTLQISQNSPYKVLQYAVDGTSHTSNQVLANQSDCPRELTLHDYIAFGSLRSGPLLQWLNIARELRAKSLSFQKEAVSTLLTQAMWQIGPLSPGGEWEWHVELDSASFGIVLLAELEGFLQSITANWLESVSVKTVIAVTSRLLASATDPEVVHRAYRLLRRARGVTFGWLRQLGGKLQGSEEDHLTVQEFQRRACEIAATCRGTFDVDPEHTEFLLNSPEDIAIFVECAIVVTDNTPPSLVGQGDFARLLGRDRRLSHFLESRLAQQIIHHRRGLDDAIKAIWAGYRPGYQWLRLESPNDRWMTTVTATTGYSVSQFVQYNLLDGCLLINGKPLGRLPREMVDDPVYARLFGQKILDVVPADIPGMDFATRDLISGYQVLFGSRDNGSTLRIQAKRGSELLELIPHNKFMDDLPALLVEDHVHWLNLSTREIELRPLENLWVSCRDNWRIYLPPGGNSTMRNRRLLLVDIRSPTMHMISTRMMPLEDMHYLIVTYEPGGRLSTRLPRLRLSFFLNNQEELESQNMSEMIIDPDQSSGTMIGLFNQMVLRRKETEGTHVPRRVLIPYGQVDFKPNGDHVRVTVDTKYQAQVRYYEYHIDINLGRLVGTVSLSSTLYKIYLHAVTSHCLPDPLTGCTGTEESLKELCSAECFSFQSLGPDDADLLGRISALTPDRSFYPVHLKAMQTVTWSELSPIAQHHGFHPRSQLIIDYANRLGLFTGKSFPVLNTSSKHAHLLERASCRARFLYPDDVSDPQSINDEDTTHVSRDFHRESPEEGVAAEVSAMVYGWPSRLTTCRDLLSMFKRWGNVSGPNDDISRGYSREWLKPKLSQIWLSLYNNFRKTPRQRAQFRLSFTLAALAYSSVDIRDLVPTLLAFATVPHFLISDPPSWPSYNLGRGFRSTEIALLEIIKQCGVPFKDSKEFSLPARPGEATYTLKQRRKSSFESRRNSQAQSLATFLDDQWPYQEPNFNFPSRSILGGSWLFEMPKLEARVRTAFLTWTKNSQLRNHIQKVQAILNESYKPGVDLTSYSVHSFSPCSNAHISPSSCVTFNWLFQQRNAPELDQSPSALDMPVHVHKSQPLAKTDKLQSLIVEFQSTQAMSVFQKIYGRDLDKSRHSLSNTKSIPLPNSLPYPEDVLVRHRDQHRQHFRSVLACIIGSLSPGPLNVHENVMFASGHWPRFTARTLLGKLAFDSRKFLEDDSSTHEWVNVLIALAEALLGFQRSERLLTFARAHKYEELYAELQNKGCDVRSGTQYPDWLLIQVENDFFARSIQIRVAQEMIAPRSRQNTALQLNMGEGKSSVIVPMVAAALSDGHRFVRVVVLKPLATQMFQLLVKRLSGLANRRIFYMPFSRSTTPSHQQVQIIHDLNLECMRVGGVLVAQPEHILSFKLMGIDRLFSAPSPLERGTAAPLLNSQRWLEANARDILDESDELLYVKYQLVYTVGQQQAMEGHPDRWTTLQQILALVHKHAPEIKRQFPESMEVQDTCQGSYPHIRITQSNAGDAIVALIAQDVMKGMLPNCSFGLLPTSARQAALRFITEITVDDDDQQLLEEHCAGTGSWNALLLLRGLLARGILVYVLKERRWRVDFGLDLSRSLLAVPYKAKDVPSLRAEFGHPDVAIALTSLSYHYQGLDQSQLDQCFELLFQMDNPTLEYESWISNNDSIPDIIRHLSGVNTKDPQQRRDIFPLFNRSHAVIDFFLSQVVFPKEAKEFPQKLATSAWDLAERKQHVTTGFSGTNDRRYLLPTSIMQDDPIDQLSTNAKVLTYLLQPENDHYFCNGQHLSTKDFLRRLTAQEPEIHVLLDVGAQMLELQNRELVKHWLSLTSSSQVLAAIYFNENDELTVLERDGSTEAFISSPFNQRLDECLVYLDDSHTRGTDLKLPRNFRAAVTLGPKVTKDRLLQGCMRMRKLGHGQSVAIFAPLEVDRGIREAAGKSHSDKIVALDVLRWVMLETCKDIEHHLPHWAQQGVDYHIRREAWDEFSSSSNLQSSVEELESCWLRPESRTLEAMYGLSSAEDTDSPSIAAFPDIDARCRELGVVSFSHAGMEEEQEREVHQEIEREREMERPPKATPAEHQLHPHVRQLVTSGRVNLSSPAFVRILSPLAHSSAASSSAWSPYLLATKDFSTTIQGRTTTSGDYLRPVNWIVSLELQSPSGTQVFVALSPYEVNALLPKLRQSKVVHLHQYAPRVTKSMKSFDDLTFYCIPQLSPYSPSPSPEAYMKIQLNLWAGQLYLPDEETYLRLCDFLGLYTPETLSADDVPIQNDGFIKPEHRESRSISRFTESPVPFLKELIGFRRKGMGYLSTPLGKILHAKLLGEADYDVDETV